MKYVDCTMCFIVLLLTYVAVKALELLPGHPKIDKAIDFLKDEAEKSVSYVENKYG